MRPFNYPIEFMPISWFGEGSTTLPPLAKKDAVRLARLIDWAGWGFPAVLNADNYLVTGSAWVQAARLFGLGTVPVVRLDQLSAADREVLKAADARLAARTGWGREIFARDRRSLAATPQHPSASVASANDALAEAASVQESSNASRGRAAPAAPNTPALTRAGDLWRLGRHTLTCSATGERKLYDTFVNDDRLADLAFVDPPQNLFHAKTRSAYAHESLDLMVDLRQAVRDGGFIAVCLDWRNLTQWQRTAAVLEMRLNDFCVWTGAGGGAPGALYAPGLKLICLFRVGFGPHINNIDLASAVRNNVLTDPADPEHASSPPASLIARLIEDSSPAGGIVLDACAGTGATWRAAERCGRSAWLVERDPHRCDTLLRKYAAETGIEPTRNGETMRALLRA